MFMSGDRLLDSASLHYSEWEASKNGTSAAVDLVPKDIVLCEMTNNSAFLRGVWR